MSDTEPTDSPRQTPTDPALEDLAARIKTARTHKRSGNEAPGPLGQADMSGIGAALRIGTELVSALIVGVGIGWLLDYWLETSPWFLVVFFFLGAAAGILNVYRAASGAGYATGYAMQPGPRKDEETSANNGNAGDGRDND